MALFCTLSKTAFPVDTQATYVLRPVTNTRSVKTNTEPFECHECMEKNRFIARLMENTTSDTARLHDDYVAAIKYINSCHSILNRLVETSNNLHSDTLCLPKIPNLPMFDVPTYNIDQKNDESMTENSTTKSYHHCGDCDVIYKKPKKNCSNQKIVKTPTKKNVTENKKSKSRKFNNAAKESHSSSTCQQRPKGRSVNSKESKRNNQEQKTKKQNVPQINLVENNYSQQYIGTVEKKSRSSARPFKNDVISSR